MLAMSHPRKLVSVLYKNRKFADRQRINTCTVLLCTEQYVRIVLYCIVLYCIVLYCIVLELAGDVM